MRKSACLWVALSVVACTFPEPQREIGELIDLTHTFDETTIYWPTSEEFQLDIVFKGQNPLGFHYEANNFSGAEHGGTHLDAPAHFYSGRQTVEQVPLNRLVGPGALIDISLKCDQDPNYQVTSGDFVAWEKAHGKLVNDHIVLLHTGFGRHWPDRSKYMGTDERGADAVPKLRFPGLHPGAAQWLIENRNIKAIGLDTPSIDFGKSTNFGSHVLLYEKNIPAFENVANLEKLPAIGFTVIALPMKIKGGSGAPLRIIAML